MRKTIMMLSLLASTAAAAPAYAQMSGVTGRAEIRAGYDEIGGTVTVEDFERETFGAGDLALGVEGGVDAMVANGLTLGAYVGADTSFADHCEDDPFFPGGEVCLEPGRNLYAGVRAGFATGDNGLVYIKGGYSNAKLRASYSDAAGDEIFGDSDTAGGWHLGGGFEIGMMSNVYLKGEYVYSNYNGFFDDTLDETSEVDLNRHQIMGGIGFRFGGATPPPPPLPPAPPPPPPPPPATQTCPDGSVILATDACPLPPAPPPPPPVESPGERG